MCKHWNLTVQLVYQTGPVVYRSRTVFEDATPEMVRDFFWDDEFRPKWDPMLAYFKMLEECPHTGTTIVHWIKKVLLGCMALALHRDSVFYAPCHDILLWYLSSFLGSSPFSAVIASISLGGEYGKLERNIIAWQRYLFFKLILFSWEKTQRRFFRENPMQIFPSWNQYASNLFMVLGIQGMTIWYKAPIYIPHIIVLMLDSCGFTCVFL